MTDKRHKVPSGLTELKAFLEVTYADQGCECTFDEFVAAVADDASEYGHTEAKLYLGLLSVLNSAKESK